MESFNVAFSNVATALLFAAAGFITCKTKKTTANHLSTVSAILIYICGPCMVIRAFLNIDLSAANLKNMGIYFVVSLALQCIFTLILFAIFHKKYSDSRYRILTVASVLGNVGFFGMPVINALFPSNPEVLCYSSINVVTMNLLVFTVGVYCLTSDKKYMTIKSALLNPTTIAFAVAIPLYLLQDVFTLPTLLSDGITLLGKMTTPVCMIILGIRLATMNFKKLFTNPFVYTACAGKLIVFPLFAYALVYFLPLDPVLKGSVLILCGTPSASVILNLAEMHHSEMEMSANCVLLSTMLSLVTIPLLSMLL